MKGYYDAKRDEAPEIKVNSKVWLEGTNITPFRPMKKLAEKRYGPFQVLKKIGPSSYKLKLPTTWKGVHPVFNEILLVPFIQPLSTQSPIHPPPTVQGNEHDHYEVEAILDTRKFRKKTKYLVKWKGYGHEDNTWQTAASLKTAPEAMAIFKAKASAKTIN
jgi:hypothetical protein